MVAGIPQPRGPASQRGRVCRLWWHLMIQSHTGKGDQKRHHATRDIISLKGGADPTGACTQNAARVEVSQMKHIIIGRKQ